MVTKDGKPTPLTRNQVIQNHIKNLEKKILVPGTSFDPRDSEFIANIVILQSFKWCLNKQVDELQQRKKEMEERLLTFEFSKIDDTIRLMKDKIMHGILTTVLEIQES